jgi:hypothetical protein
MILHGFLLFKNFLRVTLEETRYFWNLAVTGVFERFFVIKSFGAVLALEIKVRENSQWKYFGKGFGVYVISTAVRAAYFALTLNTLFRPRLDARLVVHFATTFALTHLLNHHVADRTNIIINDL